jgi:hypothetical protein
VYDRTVRSLPLAESPNDSTRARDSLIFQDRPDAGAARYAGTSSGSGSVRDTGGGCRGIGVKEESRGVFKINPDCTSQ